MTFTLADVRQYLGDAAEVHGDTSAGFDKAASDADADERTLVWINPRRADRQARVERTRSRFVLVPPGLDLAAVVAAGKCVIQVPNPKLAFIRIVDALLIGPKRRAGQGISPHASVAEGAEIDPTARIEAHAVIGRCRIGAHSVIGMRAQIGDDVTIGAHVVVGPASLVGIDGFGYTPDEAGEWQHFPHLGRVVLEDHVAIGANTCVVRGTLGDTVIGRGSKIDNLVSVGHNSRIGRRTLVAANSVIGGSAIVGDDVWVSPLAIVLNSVKVGDRAVIGAGVVAARDVEPDTTLVAAPPKPLPKSLKRRSPLA